MKYGNWWELARHLHTLQRLNRTMQYGNQKMKISGEVSSVCLNRTMQYGNYTSTLKRMRGFECLNRTMQYGNSVLHTAIKWRRTFKSYYVVWKLFPLLRAIELQQSLNRTMQYGNFEQRNISMRDPQSLNRTMQYGNKPRVVVAKKKTKV